MRKFYAPYIFSRFLKFTPRFILIIVFILGFFNNNFAQPTVLGTQLINGAYTTYDLITVGAFKQIKLQATSSAATGEIGRAHV